MDKYEFNIKLDQIKKYASKKDYKSAAKMANEMDWRKVKDWSVLATIISVQESAGDLEEARNVAILAYNRNLGGRKLVYKLTELFIRLKEFDEAEDLYIEYEKISQHDVNRYVLLYMMRKAEGATTGELIDILEEYKDHELDEKYLYELALMYSKTGRAEECVKQCEQIALWFQDGKYVERTLRLKQKYSELTASQKKLLEDTKDTEEDLDKTKEILFEEQKEKARLEEDEIEDVFREDAMKNSNNNQMSEVTTPDAVVQEFKTRTSVPISAVSNEDVTASGPSVDLVQNEVDEKVMNAFKSLLHKAIGQEEETTVSAESGHQTEAQALSAEEIVAKGVLNSVVTDVPQATSEQMQNSIEKAGQSLKELIENAKKKIESNYEQVRREDAEERLQDEVTNNGVPVTNYNLYDTQNIQKELAKNLGELMRDDENKDLFRPSPGNTETLVAGSATSSVSQQTGQEEEDEVQIEGQLCISDWIQAVREEKYGKQNTKEFSKAELEKMLDERESEKEAYERLLAKQKELAEAKGEEFDEAEAILKANQEVMLRAARTDLAIRTGKATAKLEATVENLKEAVRLAGEIGQGYDGESSDVLEVTATEDSIQYDSSADYVEPENAAVDAFEDSVEDEEIEDEEIEEDADEERYSKLYEEQEDTEQEYEDNEEYDQKLQLSKSIKKYFKKYSDMAGLEEQLAQYFAMAETEVLSKTSNIGNIIISGNRSSDKTNLAVSMVKALNTLYPDNPKKIAKTTGESINHKGLAKAISKLRGTALIVEDAGVIEPKRINEILNVMEQDTDGMIVIFEDADTEINVLLSVNPEITNKFNHRIVLKQYTVNELVEMAKKYAGKRQHAIDDDALLQLYLKIDKLHSQTECVRLDQIKEIIDKAIIRAEKRASRKLFGAVKKRRGENGDVFFLAEADFKD